MNELEKYVEQITDLLKGEFLKGLHVPITPEDFRKGVRTTLKALRERERERIQNQIELVACNCDTIHSCECVKSIILQSLTSPQLPKEKI